MQIPRTTEPLPADPTAEARQYQAMDHTAVNRKFVDELLAGGPVGDRVIDLGCGPGQIAIELCRRDPNVTVMAIDNEVEMLEIAKFEIDLAGLLDRITLTHSDVNQMESFEDQMCDTLISNSLIHHLDLPEVGLQLCRRLVADGGRLFIRDLARPISSDHVESLVSQYAGQEAPEAQQLFRQSLHAALTIDEVRDLVGGLGIEATQVQMTSDRHWTLDVVVDSL